MRTKKKLCTLQEKRISTLESERLFDAEKIPRTTEGGKGGRTYPSSRDELQENGVALDRNIKY